jgi:dCMP deaminase
VRTALRALGFFKTVTIADEALLRTLASDDAHIIMPNDEVCRELAAKYFSNKAVSFDEVFLRWDKHKAMEERPVKIDQRISCDEFDQQVIQRLKQEAQHSSDYWRRIAAAIIKDGAIILTAYNQHQPTEYAPYLHGDPRDNFSKGIGVEYSTSIHAEARLVAEAARRGISLEGSSLYATVFPCPPCAKQIAFSGIKKLYYAGGYTVLDQDILLKERGVEIIYVEGV